MDYAAELCRNMKEYKLYLVHCVPLNDVVSLPVLDQMDRSLNVNLQERHRLQLNELLKYVDAVMTATAPHHEIEYEFVMTEEQKSIEQLLEDFVTEYAPAMMIIGSSHSQQSPLLTTRKTLEQ